MAAGHSLDGLMKWLKRDEWRGVFDDVLDRHLGPATAKFGLSIDDLSSVLDEQFFGTLWGCAFEDLLTRDREEDSVNIVDAYLKRRGWKESAASRAYMQALRRSVMSLYEVSDIVAGQSFLARDLVRHGDPIRVSEQSASRSLKPWDRIGARIVPVGPKMIMGGGVLLFRFETSEEVLEALSRAQKRSRKEMETLFEEAKQPVGGAILAELFSDTDVLAMAAPLITTIWLTDTLDRVLNPALPQLMNSDGEPLQFSTVRFTLTPAVKPEEIRAILDATPEFRAESETFWNWLRLKRPRSKSRTSKAVGTGQTYSVEMDDGSTVLGTLELKGRTLVFATNSASRAALGLTLLDSVLGNRVSTPLTEIQTPEQLMASQPVGDKQSPSGLSLEDERAVVRQYLDNHYRGLLDEPIPMLGNKSPRAAVKTAKGRAKVIDWLKFLENKAANHVASDDPMALYDFSWLWYELGLGDLRR